MARSYTFSSWLRTRDAIATSIAVVLIGSVVCTVGRQVVIPLSLNSGERRWDLTAANFCSIGLSLLISINTLPRAAHWEQPLRRRVRIAHGCTWILVTAAGAAVTTATVMLNGHDRGHSEWSQVAFHLATAGLGGVAVALLGKNAGAATFLGLVLVIILGEQSLGSQLLLTDIRHAPAWGFAGVCTVGGWLAMTATGGHGVPTRHRSTL